MIFSHSIDIKDKNKKIINVKAINNINKIFKNIKSLNKNNIRLNENKAISLRNKTKRKIKLYNDYKTKLLDKNKIITIINNNKKGKNKYYKKK